MNGPTRKRYYAEMVNDEGEFCKICGVTRNERQLVIDHKDNNNSNNLRENRQLLCRTCNFKKNPRRPVDECVSETEVPDRPSELKCSMIKRPKFRKLAYHEVTEHVQIVQKELLNLSSEVLDICQVTAMRYLDAMCSKAGLLERRMIGNTVVIQYKSEIPLI